MHRVKKLKIQLSAAIFLFFCMIIFGGFFSPDFKNFAQALSTNYSKTLPGATLNLTEWNNLDDDFVAKSGGTMSGILNMGNNRITNVATPTILSPASDVANKEYVDAQIAAFGGSSAADIFVNWGREVCPDESELLYSGIGFSAGSDSIGGSSNVVCLDAPAADGGPFLGTYADFMYPLVTGSGSLPGAITTDRAVKCAVCRHVGTCYETYGNSACNSGKGFKVAYTGYLLGAHSNSGTYLNSTERVCVNSTFDGSLTPSGTPGAVLIGTRVDNDLNLGYSEGVYILCSVCCN